MTGFLFQNELKIGHKSGVKKHLKREIFFQNLEGFASKKRRKKAVLA